MLWFGFLIIHQRFLYKAHIFKIHILLSYVADILALRLSFVSGSLFYLLSLLVFLSVLYTETCNRGNVLISSGTCEMFSLYLLLCVSMVCIWKQACGDLRGVGSFLPVGPVSGLPGLHCEHLCLLSHLTGHRKFKHKKAAATMRQHWCNGHGASFCSVSSPAPSSALSVLFIWRTQPSSISALSPASPRESLSSRSWWTSLGHAFSHVWVPTPLACNCRHSNINLLLCVWDWYKNDYKSM